MLHKHLAPYLTRLSKLSWQLSIPTRDCAADAKKNCRQVELNHYFHGAVVPQRGVLTIGP